MVIVTITNNSASPISNWAICFDYADSIENIWDAVIEANANGAYSHYSGYLGFWRYGV